VCSGIVSIFTVVLWMLAQVQECSAVPRKVAFPAYGLHRASGQAVVRIDGHDYYLGPYGSPESKAKYHELARKAMADRTKADVERSILLHVDITVAELASRYLLHAETYYTKNGKATSQLTIIKLTIGVLLDRYAYLEAREFGPLSLIACQEAFVSKGLSRGEVNRRVRLIRQIFQWGVSKQLVSPTILLGLQSVVGLRKGRTTAPDRPPVRPVREQQVEAVLAFVSPQVAAMIQLQSLTGMRPNEVVMMRGCDLNTAGSIWEYRPEHHKLDHLDVERVIMIGPKAQAILKPWLRPELEAYLFSPADVVEDLARTASECWADRRTDRAAPSTRADLSRDTKAIWGKLRERRGGTVNLQHVKKRPSRRKRPPQDHYTVNSYRRAIARGCDLAFPHPELSGIKKKDLTAEQKAELNRWRKPRRWSPNRLRHTAATLVRREMGIDAARACLGHSDADTTTIYAERDKELARVAMERLG
jgi:integrase